MTRRLRAVSLALLLLLAGGAGLARADVVLLRNGRRIEGKVLARSEREVRLKTASGVMVLPAAAVARVDLQMSAEEELGDRVHATDMTDPKAVEALALWASSRGLGAAARDLLALSRGLRLERLVAEAQRSGAPEDFVSVFHWARTNGGSDEVLDWLLAQARAIDPQAPAVLSATATLAADRAARAREEAHREELRRRPSYVDPEQERRFAAVLGQVDEAPGHGHDGLVALLERARARQAAGAPSSPGHTAAPGAAKSGPPPAAPSAAR
jgi:hypothetical protein